MEILAIDVGGVLASKQHDGQPQPGSLEVVNQLSTRFDLWIVSQCGHRRQLKTIDWLAQWGFPFPRERQIYVDFDHSKVDPLNELHASYFVDDRWNHISSVLVHVPSVVKAFHLLAEPDQCAGCDRCNPLKHNPRYARVLTWQEIAEKLP